MKKRLVILVMFMQLIVQSITAQIKQPVAKKKPVTKKTTAVKTTAKPATKPRTTAPKVLVKDTTAKYFYKEETTKSSTSVTNTDKLNVQKLQVNKPLQSTHISSKTFLTSLGVGATGGGFPIILNVEKFVIPDLSVALTASYEYLLYYALFNGDYNYSNVDAGLRCNYYLNHLLGNKSKRYHVYVGAQAVYYSTLSSNKAVGVMQNGIVAGGQVGARLFFTKRIAFYAEANYKGALGAQIGLTFKNKK